MSTEHVLFHALVSKVTIRHWNFDNCVLSPAHGREVRDPMVLCKTCSRLLCVLEQQIVDNSSARPIGRIWYNWLKADPVPTNPTNISF